MIRFRKYSLALAESFDAWRVVPRMILVAYGLLVINLYQWFRDIPTYLVERCDAAVLQLLLNSNMSLDAATQMACQYADVIGGPTAAQSAFVTTIIGLSTGIFGLYTTTGRRWDGGMPSDINSDFKQPSDNRDDSSPRVVTANDNNGPVI